MKNMLDSSMCSLFRPSFLDTECDFYAFAENDAMEPVSGVCGYCKKDNAYRCIADIGRVVPLSHSSVDTFLTCHYLYYLKKICGIEMKPPFFGPALKAGRLWDQVKQFRLGEKAIPTKDVIEEYQIDDITVAKVRALYNAYKELGIKVEPDYELQAKINTSIKITVPPSALLPNLQDDNINFWAIRDNLQNDKRVWTFDLSVTGFYDRKYQTYFCEDKLSSRPEFYLDPFFLQSQNATYFLADPNLEYCIQEVVLFPQQKIPKNKSESADVLGQRIFDDIISRPSKYFIGYDRTKKMYGKKFFRGEFDLKAAEERYQQVVLEITSCRWTGNFYRNFKVCNNILPGIPCDMRDICTSGNMSENIFRIREKK